MEKRYVGFTEDLCKAYTARCARCVLKAPRKKVWVELQPIVERRSFARWQLDLMDFQSQPCKNAEGVVCKWVMHAKDHFTKFSYLVALPNKRDEVSLGPSETCCVAADASQSACQERQPQQFAPPAYCLTQTCSLACMQSWMCQLTDQYANSTL